MAIDPILYAAINNLKEPFGAARIVDSNFSSASYLNAGGIFKSSDYPNLARVLPNATGCQGTFFTKVGSNPLPNVLPFNPASLVISDNGLNIIAYSGNVFTAGQANRMWASNDGGITWAQSNWLAVSPNTWFGIVADRNNGFVAYGNSTATFSGSLITSKSSDGINWSSITTHSGQTYPLAGFYISANNTWFASNGNNTSVKKSANGTGSWSTVSGISSGMTVPTSWQFGNFENRIFFFAPKLGVWVSSDDGSTAGSLIAAGTATTSTVIFRSTKSYCLINYNSGDWQYSLNGYNWSQIPYASISTIGNTVIDDWLFSFNAGSKTGSKSVNGINYNMSSPIYVDDTILTASDPGPSSWYSNFTRTILYALTSNFSLIKSVDSTYDTYKVLAPATSTTPGTKVVIRAK